MGYRRAHDGAIFRIHSANLRPARTCCIPFLRIGIPSGTRSSMLNVASAATQRGLLGSPLPSSSGAVLVFGPGAGAAKLQRREAELPPEPAGEVTRIGEAAAG